MKKKTTKTDTVEREKDKETKNPTLFLDILLMIIFVFSNLFWNKK